MAGLTQVLTISAIALGLAACSTDAQRSETGDSSNQGLNLSGLVSSKKNPPDEFAVAPSKPLELPKNFTALPTPTPGTRSPLRPDPIAQARAALLGDGVEPQAANARLSASESALLASTGTANADPNIRNILEAEEAERKAARPDFLLNRLFPSNTADASAALTPEEERVRLSENLPQRQIGSTDIATISPRPTANSSPQATATPTATTARPSVAVAAPENALPKIDPVTGSELIFIPE